MTDDKFEMLFMRVAAQQMAMSAFVRALVIRLTRDGSLNAELLLEQLHMLQASLPGFGPDADPGQRAIAEEVSKAWRHTVQAVDDALDALASGLDED